ncbi:MAG: thioredoxin domain-containing protein [Chitinophagales bacterium]|nr:thioredoxin domain-containing protein [Hyphomicrobiales bacterium]
MRFGHGHCTDAVEKTLLHICQGGIYDHIGGGFSRYAVDARWLVPHFEKMLYDNAQLIEIMTEVWRERRSPLLAIRIAETVDWLMREMKAPDGGFASALDADSEGVEGKFYVWSRTEIIAALGEEDGAFFCQVYDISEHGNWEEANIPNRLKSLELLPAEDEARLYALRSNLLAKRALRERPSWDDKVLADWNGLIIAALAKAGQAFEHPEWVDVAKSAYEFVKLRLVKVGRLMHSYRAGQAKTPGVATDYANMIAAAIALQQVTGEVAFIADAKGWARSIDERYTAEGGGYYLSADDTTDVMIRTLAAHDDATPNANPIMLANLNALYLLTGDDAYRTRAQRLYEAFSGALAQRFVNHCGFLNSLIDVIEPKLIVITGAEDEAGMTAMRNALLRASLSGAVIHTYRSDETIPESSPAAGKTSIGGKATAYICIGQTCSLPVTDANDLASQLRPDQDKAVIR